MVVVCGDVMPNNTRYPQYTQSFQYLLPFAVRIFSVHLYKQNYRHGNINRSY